MTISPFTLAHLHAAVQQWPRLAPRLHALARTPYAVMLRAEERGAVIGLIGALRFEAHARVVLLRAAPEDDEAIRAALLSALLERLRGIGVDRIIATVRVEKMDAWHSLGFRAHEPLLRYHGGRFLAATHEEVVPLEPRHTLGMLHLDQRATGLRRHALLAEHAYLGKAYEEHGALRGFALPLLGHGLIVADAPHAGLELQRWLLPVQDHLLLPEGNTAHAHLTAQGYRTEVLGIRLVLGTQAFAPSLVFADPFGAL